MLETDTSSGLQQLMRLRVTIAKVISAAYLLIITTSSQTVSMLSRIMADMESASIAQCVFLPIDFASYIRMSLIVDPRGDKCSTRSICSSSSSSK